MAITLSAPTEVARAGGLVRETVTAVRRSVKRVEVSASPPGERIGGLPTRGAVLTVEEKAGQPVRILLGVGRGKKLAYLTQIVLRDPGGCGQTLLEGQLILNSVRFSR